MQVLTANNVLTGEPVYLDLEGNWIKGIENAHRFSEREAFSLALEAARAQETLICDPMGIKIQDKGGVERPKGLKFQLRASGGDEALRRLGFDLDIFARPQHGSDGGCSNV